MAEPFSWSGLLAPDSPFMQQAGDIGWGLLANSGPLPGNTPGGGGFGARLGRAGIYAGERANERTLNEARRMEIAASKREQEGIAGFQEWMKANPDATEADVTNMATTFLPELAIKARMSNILSPADRAQMMNTQATLLKIQQELVGKGAETTTPAGVVARAVTSLADAFDAAEKEDNPFAPGGTFYKEAPIGKLGLTADTVMGMPESVLSQFGDPVKIKAQAQTAQLIDKETATLAQSITSLGSQGTGRSATALENMQTSLGQGNIAIPVRRKVITATLETVIDDLQAKGLPVDPSWLALRDRLKEQTKGVGKASPTSQQAGKGYVPGVGVVAQPAPSTTITPHPSVPQRAGMVPGAQPTPTMPLNAAGRPVFTRKPDLERALKNGWVNAGDTVIFNGQEYTLEAAQ